MTLNKINAGTLVRVTDIIKSEYCTELLELGFVAGTKIRLLQVLSGGGCVVRLRGDTLYISGGLSRLIKVSRYE